MHIITTHLEWDPSALSTVTCLDIYIYSFTWPLKKCGVFLLHQDYSVFKVYCCWFPNIKVSLNPEKLITELGGQLCLGWDRIWGFDQTVMEAKALWKLLSFTVWAVNQPPPEGSKLPLNSAPFSVFFNIIHFMSGLCSIAPSLVYYWKAISPQLLNVAYYSTFISLSAGGKILAFHSGFFSDSVALIEAINLAPYLRIICYKSWSS